MPKNPFHALATLLRMIKFSHTLFALPFALLATFLAANGGTGGFCGWEKLVLILLCMVFARSAAMTFNRIADVRIDAHNPRTANREIPTGKISIAAAWIFFITCAILFIAATALFYFPLGPFFGFANPWPVFLSIPTLFFICTYSYTKRFTWLSHFWLGASLMLAPVGAWLAISPPDGPLTSVSVWLLGVAVLLWVGGFDIIYACQDIDVDRRDKLHSIPARFGIANALWISRCCHSLCLALLLLFTQRTHMGWFFFVAVILTALLFTIEHILVRKGKMTHIHIAFGLINGIVSLLVAAAGIADILI